MNFFEVIWNDFTQFIRNMSTEVWGGIIFAICMGALISFIYATRGSKKEKLIKNYFLLYLSIALVLVGVLLTFMK